MSTVQFRPAFTSARGTVAEWFDPQGMRRAFEHYARLRHQHHVAYVEAARARDPGYDECLRRLREASGVAH